MLFPFIKTYKCSISNGCVRVKLFFSGFLCILGKHVFDRFLGGRSSAGTLCKLQACDLLELECSSFVLLLNYHPHREGYKNKYNKGVYRGSGDRI